MQSNDLWGVLNGLGSDDKVTLVFVVLASIVGLVGIICGTVYAMHKNRLNDALRRDLLDRGMSAEEIATIMAADPKETEPHRKVFGRRVINV